MQELLLSKSVLSTRGKRKLSKVERQYERRQKRERDREKREYERKRRRERHGKHRKDGLVTEHFIPVSHSSRVYTVCPGFPQSDRPVRVLGLV